MKLPTYITGSVQTKAYAVLREEVYKILAKYDLVPSYWSMLGIILEARDGIRQADVAKAMNVKPPLITVMVRQMESRGIVQTVQNQFDARAKLLSITPEGKKLIKSADNDLNSHLDLLLNGLTETDLISYHKVLTTIIFNSEDLK
jgi:DNA-binding MarR family transcriptional regulator